MKDFRWFWASDKSKCYLREWHTDSVSLLVHINNVGEFIKQLLEVAEISRFEFFGSPNDEVREVAAQFGAAVYENGSGFSRVE